MSTVSCHCCYSHVNVRHFNGASPGNGAVAYSDAIAAPSAALGAAGSEWSTRQDRQLQPAVECGGDEQ